MQGKGSARRPTNEAAYGRNYEAIRWKGVDKSISGDTKINSRAERLVSDGLGKRK